MYSDSTKPTQVKCSKCDIMFTIKIGTYKRRGSNHQWVCKSCTAIDIWNNLSKGETEKRSSSQKNRWNKLTAEEKALIMTNTREAQIKYCSTPEAKEKLANRNKIKWKSLSREERESEKNRLNKIREEYWEKLSDVERFTKMKKMWDSQVNVGPTEYQFMNSLKINGFIKDINFAWGFNSYPFIHKDYYSTFGKINPVTTEENFPYHNWDFIIFSKISQSILVDVDGSAHDKDSMKFYRGENKYTEREKIDYNDSQRLYQIPTGMDAYVIECYNDKLDDNTPVLNLISGKRISYKELSNIILFSQYSRKDLKGII